MMLYSHYLANKRNLLQVPNDNATVRWSKTYAGKVIDHTIPLSDIRLNVHSLGCLYA